MDPTELEDTLTSTRTNASLVALLLFVAALVGGTAGYSAPPAETTTSVIGRAADAATASRPVAAPGGAVTREPGIIRAAGARLAAARRDRLAGAQGVLHLLDDGSPEVACTSPEQLAADLSPDPPAARSTGEDRGDRR